jgi:hypothetical protein
VVSKRKAGSKDSQEARPAPVFKAPLKPRPILFRVLLGVVALWVATLLTLYFTTVYPHRGGSAPAGDIPSEHPAR